MVILRKVHDVWKCAHTLYVQISTACLYTKKVKEKNVDAMHHLYVLVGVMCRASGLKPDPRKVSTIHQMASPANQQELLSFMG